MDQNNLECEADKDECKINFKLVTKEGEKDISSKYKCEIITDFDIGENKNKCNPSTITIPKDSEQIIKFKIYNKRDGSNFVEKEILIKNIFEEIEDEVEDEDEDEEKKGEENNTITEFIYLLQSPSYAREMDQNNLECEADKDECKINLKLVTKEGEKDISSKYKCEIITDFDIGENKNKCNPSTITIPKDSDENIKFIIYDKNNKTIFRELEIFVDNTITHYLSYTKIQVQGKITKYKKLGYKNITCLTYDKCSINFTASNYNSSTNYKWDFRNGERYYGYNPKTVKFSPGFYRVKLITTDDFGNRKVDLYKVTVKQLLKKAQQKEVKEGLKKILDYKKTAYNLLDEEINITKNINKTKKELVKKFNIEKIKKNIDKNITLKNIFGKGINKKVVVKKDVKNKINPNPLSGTKDEENKIKIKLLKKNIKYSVSFQKKSLKISGETLANSKVEIKIGEKIFLTTSDNIGKYELKINSLVAGKYKILISAFNKDGILVGEKYTSEKEITEKYISQLNNYKYKQYLSSIKKSKSKSKKKTTTKIKKFKVEKINYSSIIPINTNKNFSFKIFAINTLITILSFIFMSFILIRRKII
ncbi:MAG: hypothetical protein Q9M97_08430 [Candidatus Gracilibacteria bacterium]|nr:hypothetical protein [Candidatus Gracilibacteria bacterium]